MRRWVSQIEDERQDSNFNDSQNIHDSHLILTARESINRLIDLKVYDTNVLEKIITDLDVNSECIKKLIDYSRDLTVHNALSVTFLDVLSMVYPLIRRLPEPFEVKKILATEMEAAEDKDLTDKIVHLLNVLNGF